MSGENLWPEDIANGTTRAPTTILREQTVKLGHLTQGVIAGTLLTRASGRGDLSTEFRLVVPAIDGYEYSLLSIQYPPTFYPMKMQCDAAKVQCEVKTEQEFLDALKEVFGSPEVKRIVQSLIAQCAA